MGKFLELMTAFLWADSWIGWKGSMFSHITLGQKLCKLHLNEFWGPSFWCFSLNRIRVGIEKTTTPYTPFHTHPHSSALTLFWAVTAHLIHHSQSFSFSQKLSLKCVTNSSRQKGLLGLRKGWEAKNDMEHVCNELGLPLVLDYEGTACQTLCEEYEFLYQGTGCPLEKLL